VAMRRMQEVLRENAKLQAENESLKLALRRSNTTQLELEKLRRILAETVDHLARADNRLIRANRSNTELRNQMKELKAENNTLHNRMAKVVVMEVLKKESAA
jgi:regulator of replication initiation timing